MWHSLSVTKLSCCRYKEKLLEIGFIEDIMTTWGNKENGAFNLASLDHFSLYPRKKI